MDKRIITVTLNPAVDRTLTIPNFQPGSAFLKSEEQVTAGGKGVNVSRALNVLGVKNLATGILGGCSGKITFLKMMRKERINQDFYKFGGYTRANLTIIDPQAGRTTQLLESGPKISAEQAEGFLEKFKEKIKTCSFLIISGRNAVGLPDHFCATLIELVNASGVPVLLDTHGVSLKLALSKRPLMVTPNLAEAEELLGRSLNTVQSRKKALTDINRLGAKVVFMKLGNEGAIAYDGKEYLSADRINVKTLNDVGCGDAFSAGLATAYFKKMDLSGMLSFASAAAIASAETTVPALFELKEFKRILRNINTRKF